MESLPLAPQGVFWTVQGEGAMLGVPQVFVRLAGCSVGCSECDTDYTVAERVPVKEIVRRALAEANGARWVWLTGGEPTIHDLAPLVEELRRYGFLIALATAGVNPVHMGRGMTVKPGGFDFVSVSPHKLDATWVQRRGCQLNIVPGLNGLALADLDGVDVSGFAEKWVTPCWYHPAQRMERVTECAEWVKARPQWRLGVQAHKAWGVA